MLFCGDKMRCLFCRRVRDAGSWIMDRGWGYRTFSDHFSNLLETTLLYNILKTTIIFIFNKLLLIVCCLLLLLLLHVYFVTRLNSMIVDHPFICSLILSFHSRFLSIHHLLRSCYYFFFTYESIQKYFLCLLLKVSNHHLSMLHLKLL